MIVAGIGSRSGVGEAEVLAAIAAALGAHGLARSALASLATTEARRGEAGIFAAGRTLGLPVAVIATDAASAFAGAVSSPSPLSQRHAGTPSVSETAALAAAGPGARLAGPRLALGRVTCAIAIGADQ
jgi:cobalt-precorrin 5A hydrolase